jgi:hypothetical protein
MNLGELRLKTRYETNSRRRLEASVQREGPEFWPDKWILHHKNAFAHDALRVCEFLAKISITKKDHPYCLPDLGPYNFWLCPKLKTALKG